MEGTERTEILLREEQYLFASQERMVGGIQPEGPGHIQPRRRNQEKRKLRALVK